MRELLPEAFQPCPGLLQCGCLDGAMRDFPLDKGLLRRLPKLSLIGIAIDYLYSYLRYSLGCDGTNLEDWMRYRLTAPLLRLSKLDQYIIKMQGLPVTQLSPVLGEQRLRDIHEMNRPGRILRILLFSSKKMREFM